MIKEVRCYDCNQIQSLEFPEEFEGHPISTYEQIRSYVSFRSFIKDDHSYGKFVWDSKGNEIWLCPKCLENSFWLAGGD